MPRPGPRPYECVRRTWHSDRHQPIRGSLIQEIFRVVNEIHCSATKKNKEWQEKIPIVVLKAEEIMYSKANSESDYMDLDTLLDRTNDAINTIIRRDKTNETGELLQPCIEAALTLGCTPRRTSRSQRNNIPHCYLSGSSQEPAAIKEQISLWQPIPLVNCASNNKSLFLEKVMAKTEASLGLPPSQPQLSFCSVYPLYYGSCCPEGKTFPCSFRFVDDSSGGLEQETDKDSSNKKPEMTSSCDLSLRLGPHPPCSGFLLDSQQNEQFKRQRLYYSTDVEDHGSHWLTCSSAREIVPRHPGS